MNNFFIWAARRSRIAVQAAKQQVHAKKGEQHGQEGHNAEYVECNGL